MGAVWLATDRLLERDVAVKQVVSTEGLTEESANDTRSRALREGQMTARLSHRNAIAMHDLVLDAGEPWLVMEYLPSRSVAQILHTIATIPVAHAAHIGAQVAAAMATAHAAGIVHRDIKPGNILIANTGRAAGTVKISDFGISRAIDDVGNVESAVITGTPAFFAPELARGGEPTEASDVYSLGATVYTAVEGEPPFGVDEDSLVLLHRVARGEINPPTRAGYLTPVLLAMLEPSPVRRPTMAQARDQLARIAAGPGGNVRAILQSPLSRNDGAIAIWGLPQRPSGRSSRSSPRTESGLPAARVHPTPARPAIAPVTPPAPTPPAPAGAVTAPTSPDPDRPIPPAASTLPISPAVIGVVAVVALVVLVIVLVVAL